MGDGQTGDWLRAIDGFFRTIFPTEKPRYCVYTEPLGPFHQVQVFLNREEATRKEPINLLVLPVSTDDGQQCDVNIFATIHLAKLNITNNH